MSWQGRPVAIIGTAAHQVCRFVPKGTDQLPVPEAEMLAGIAQTAMANAGISAADVGAAAFTAPGRHSRQQGFAAFMAARLGLRCQAFLGEVSAMGITGGLAIEQAINSIALGQCDVAIALGIIYETALPGSTLGHEDLYVTGHADFQAPFGLTPISWYALDAARYIHETGITREQIAAVAVKSRKLAASNPLAQFRSPLTLEEVLSQRMIVEPLGLFEVPAIADGAACIVFAAEDIARALGQPYSSIRGRALGHDGYHQMGQAPHDMTRFPALARAAEAALGEAGISISDLDVAELYAPCTITEVLACEAIGISARGAGALDAIAGETMPGGRIAVNSSGGCLSRGHPAPVTALYGLIELDDQLCGRSGDRQMKDAAWALHACELGNYNSALVHVLEGPR